MDAFKKFLTPGSPLRNEVVQGFRSKYTFEQRQEEAWRISQKFPGRVPVLVERGSASKTVPQIDKQKFLVPSDLTLGQFVFVIRKRMELPSESALFCFIGGSLPTTGSLMRELFGRFKDEDGFLYVSYCGENTFGGQKPAEGGFPPPYPLSA